MAKMDIAQLIGSAQALSAAGHGALAAELYRDWASMNPDDPILHAMHFNRGVLLADAGDLPAAIEAFTAAIGRKPDFLPPYINLGAALERLGAKAQAYGQWAHVSTSLTGVSGETVAYKAAALKQMAQVLEANRQLAEAEDTLRQVAELTPWQRDVVQHWISLRQRQCQWPVLAPIAGHDRAALLRRIAPLSMACLSDDPVMQLAVAASHMREDVGMPPTFRDATDFARRCTEIPGRRLRLGYLSSDLREHAIGSLMAEMFGLHDRTAFEVFVYYCGVPQEDATKVRIRGSVEHWRDIAALDDAAAEAVILADGIDILVDVNGHTRGARTRLLTRRPAPIIVNWLGYPGSMGSACHHYIIADRHIVPPGSERFYSETVVRLGCYQPNDRQRPTPAAADRAAHGLPHDGTVFCSFNGAQKVTPAVFGRWMAILRGVPDSVLWLLKSCEEVEERLRARAIEAGVAPDRLIFAPIVGAHAHLARYPLADLFLDTFPYGAHTTASDALWMGVPVLTVPGRGFAARVCGSLVHAAGLPELICASPEDYVARAIEYGRERASLAQLRDRLLAGREHALLFDTPRLVRELEDLFRSMWDDFAKGWLPKPNVINLDTYLEIGSTFDHEAAEASFLPQDDARWRDALARRHAYSPLPADGRLVGGG